MQQIIDIFIQTVVPIVIAFIASSGFWVYLDKKRSPKSLQTELLLGLSHDRIVYLGTQYLAKKWISHDEYENILKIYKPYEELGGNGSAKRIMEQLKTLPMEEPKKQGETK